MGRLRDDDQCWGRDNELAWRAERAGPTDITLEWMSPSALKADIEAVARRLLYEADMHRVLALLAIKALVGLP